MIIGISGKKRSGKDSFFHIVKEQLKTKHPVKRYAFADKVKEFAVEYFNIRQDEIKNEENRFILQGIGKMVRDELSKDFWINAVFSEIYKSRLKNPGEISIITDVRYKNEADSILKLDDSLLLRIINKNNNHMVDYHDSENDLNDYHFDYTIDNSGTLEEYEKKVKLWLRSNLPWIIHW